MLAVNSIQSVLMLLGQRVKIARLQQNFTQAALAQRCGVAYSTLRKIESSGVGAIADYAAILWALGQLGDLADWAHAGQFGQYGSLPATVVDMPLRKRAGQRGKQSPVAGQYVAAASAQAAQTASPTAVPIAVPAASPAAVVRKSEVLGLDFPYDWSNAHITDAALIGKVLDRARFMDVSKIFAHFGAGRVEQVAQDFEIDLHAGALGALMPGIAQGELRVSNP